VGGPLPRDSIARGCGEPELPCCRKILARHPCWFPTPSSTIVAPTYTPQCGSSSRLAHPAPKGAASYEPKREGRVPLRHRTRMVLPLPQPTDDVGSSSRKSGVPSKLHCLLHSDFTWRTSTFTRCVFIFFIFLLVLFVVCKLYSVFLYSLRKSGVSDSSQLRLY
jgi:hypothetical protein